ncbi:hypothetical protein EDD27_5438 [Nonomuraea polychroma]|uniref:Uncharacterized protein n=1 Tax=Nonomuraea polychroma TaxID=46176 RepID=A0A438MAV3_9ACTN|nr:hypothetical protein [Nonomuraea polychroma]RVX42775.1 hypothetical protein EDD27_5438 [Nonomuraea polychroma]
MAAPPLYEAIVRDPDRPIWIRLHRAFAAWAQSKGFPAPDTGKARQQQELSGMRLIMERRADCGRYLMEEPDRRTKVIFLDGRPGWTLISVEGSGPARAPGFIPGYLRTARITDGAIHLEDRATLVTEAEVHQLLRALEEPRRRAPIVVVTPGADNSTRADQLAAAVAGAALVVRLADRQTEELFNKLIGRDLGAYGGAIRRRFVLDFAIGAGTWEVRLAGPDESTRTSRGPRPDGGRAVSGRA